MIEAYVLVMFLMGQDREIERQGFATSELCEKARDSLEPAFEAASYTPDIVVGVCMETGLAGRGEVE